MRRLSLALLQLTVFTVPWETIVTVTGLGTVTRGLGLAAATVGILGVTFRGHLRRPSLPLVLIALFLLWSIVTVFWTIDPAGSATRVITYAQLLALVWLVWEYAPFPRAQSALMRAYVLGAYVPIVMLYVVLSSGVVAPRYTAAGQDPNGLGVTVALGIPMAWHLMLERTTWMGKSLYGAYIPAAIAAILLTGSRGAFLAGVVATSLVLWNFAGIGVRSKVVASALAIVTAGVAYTKVPEASFERVYTIRTEIQGGRLSGRREIWRNGVSEFLAHPLLGVGAGGFGAAVGDASHNAFLSILVEEGLVGACIFAAAWILLLARARAMPAVERSFWLLLCLTWAVADFSLNWDYHKTTWFILALLATRVGSPGLRPQVSARPRGIRPRGVA